MMPRVVGSPVIKTCHYQTSYIYDSYLLYSYYVVINNNDYNNKKGFDLV